MELHSDGVGRRNAHVLRSAESRLKSRLLKVGNSQGVKWRAIRIRWMPIVKCTHVRIYISQYVTRITACTIV